MNLPSRNQRRWTRLGAEALTSCQLKWRLNAAEGDLRLADLGPAGMGAWAPLWAKSVLSEGREVVLLLRFREAGRVRAPALVRHVQPDVGRRGLRIGFELLPIPEPSMPGRTERRIHPRLHIDGPQRMGFRIGHPHGWNLWSQTVATDCHVDLGFGLRTLGGPVFLLPGMEFDLHADLPGLPGRPIRCQTMWSNPQPDLSFRLGVLCLEPDEWLRALVEEWLELYGSWSAVERLRLGFRGANMPGRRRFHRIQTRAEACEAAQLQARAAAKPPLGMEHVVLPDPPRSTWTIGCRQAGQLAASITLAEAPSRSFGPDSLLVADIFFDRELLAPVVVRELWEQAVGLFLTSRRRVMWVAVPPLRRRLFVDWGLRSPAASPPSVAVEPEPLEWMILQRSTVLAGNGMRPAMWQAVYGALAHFSLRQRAQNLSVRLRIRRAAWIAISSSLGTRDQQRARDGIDFSLKEWILSSMAQRVSLEDLGDGPDQSWENSNQDSSEGRAK